MIYFVCTTVVLLCAACGTSARVLNATESPSETVGAAGIHGIHGIHHIPHEPQSCTSPSIHESIVRSRRRRYITQSDMIAILDYHNQVRANVFPPAANMEYMYNLTEGIIIQQLWDDGLARTAEAWAATCRWEHGPAYLLQFYGQNLSVRTGGFGSILELLKPWYDEVKDYVFPYPRFCNPRCPMHCYGPMCTHYTQMVWASTTRVGCALQTCYNMFVWGEMWREATYLVCNYSPKGNWIGEPPYQVGVPCSACPPSYGGSCSNHMCFPGIQSNYMAWFK